MNHGWKPIGHVDYRKARISKITHATIRGIRRINHNSPFTLDNAYKFNIIGLIVPVHYGILRFRFSVETIMATTGIVVSAIM